MTTYNRSINEAIPTPSDHVSVSLIPSVQDRDWRLRWEMLEERHRSVVGPRGGAFSAAAIHNAAQSLFEFFVSAYHLKDALIEDGARPKRVVEDAIKNSGTLALLADLANLDKHRKLRRSRSKGVPVVDRFRGSAHSGAEGWLPVVTFRHLGQEVDGIAFATQVMDEWRALLKSWGLV